MKRDPLCLRDSTQQASVSVDQSLSMEFEALASVEDPTKRSELEETELGSHFTTLVSGEGDEPATEPDAQANNTDENDGWGGWEEIFDVPVQPAPIAKNDVGLVAELPQQARTIAEDPIQRPERDETELESHFTTLVSGEGEEPATESDAQVSTADNNNALEGWEESYDVFVQPAPVPKKVVDLIDETPLKESVQRAVQNDVSYLSDEVETLSASGRTTANFLAYMFVLCDFAKVTLHERSALQTPCFSLSENDSEITRRITSPAGLKDWRKNAGMLLTSGASIATDSEKSKRFLSLIDQVGDALLSQNDEVVGSHVCYLLSGRLSSLDRNTIYLLGANSKIAPERPRSFESPAAILQSIVFEATVNARNGKTCPHLLPFRLLLALETASVGRAELRAHLDVQEKGEKLTRFSALGKSLTSVFARGFKDQTGKQLPQELANKHLTPSSQTFEPVPAAGLHQVHVALDHTHVNQTPHLSIDSQRTSVLNPVQASQFSNGTVGLITSVVYDLSPPPPSRAPPVALLGQGQPSPFGLDGGAGTRVTGQPLTPSHMRSASVEALPSEYFSSSSFAGILEVTTGQRIQSFEDRPHVSTLQMDISSGKTEQALFNCVPVQKATREEKSDALMSIDVPHQI
ncbi:hypothetical protein FGB62_243g027 [Gracilaria domingensis]|nr:hypothetical protein FGB62_243g027 [Gracilaria domingensis]